MGSPYWAAAFSPSRVPNRGPAPVSTALSASTGGTAVGSQRRIAQAAARVPEDTERQCCAEQERDRVAVYTKPTASDVDARSAEYAGDGRAGDETEADAG